MADHAIVDTITIRVRPFQWWLPQLVAAVAEIGGAAPEVLRGPTQTKRIVTLRQLYALAARDVMRKSFQEISRGLGRLDHTTSRQSYLNARERFAEDAEFRQIATVILDIARVITSRPTEPIAVEPELPL